MYYEVFLYLLLFYNFCTSNEVLEGVVNEVGAQGVVFRSGEEDEEEVLLF